ncbi:MAG TPA: RluA family pseudouridine synthase [Flavobacteriales bacterium]|nr:RluA family pseudouridine synthase [Flavobacteriales bacterium]
MSNTDGPPLDIVFRDAHLLAVNKPPGMAVQPDRTGDACLLDLVSTAFPAAAIGSPHRLDRPVSGLVVLTLDAGTLSAMDQLFRERRVTKTYLAVVEGITAQEGTLAHRLVHRGGTRKATVAPANGGKKVELRFRVRHTGERYTLLEVEPQGGAFHQIRAQLAAMGHPIKGDVKYGARRGERDRSIALHAWRLAFVHPVTGLPVEVEAPLPEGSLLKKLFAAPER